MCFRKACRGEKKSPMEESDQPYIPGNVFFHDVPMNSNNNSITPAGSSTSFSGLTRAASVGEMKHNKQGMAYMAWGERFAETPFVDKRLPFMAPHADIEARYGVGNRLYFDIVILALVSNFLIYAVGLAQWVLFMVTPTRVAVNGPFEYKDFFVAEYIRGANEMEFFITSCVSIGLTFLFPVLYVIWWGACWPRRVQKAAGATDPDEEDDVIHNNLKYSYAQLIARRLFVAFVFILAVGIAGMLVSSGTSHLLILFFFFFLLFISSSSSSIGGAFFGIIIGENRLIQSFIRAGTTDPATRARVAMYISLISGVALVIFSLLWQPLCTALTKFEKHR